jgi:SagB-type dehydrogenase family enzyme
MISCHYILHPYLEQISYCGYANWVLTSPQISDILLFSLRAYNPGRIPMRNSSESLPPPRRDSKVSLEKAIQLRRSVRSYRDKPITEDELGQILWAAQGLRDEHGYRNVPSAGALYPLELFTVAADGVSQYQPNTHSLVRSREGDFRQDLTRAALDQEFILQAPVTIVIAAVSERTAAKYGNERAPRYIDIEVGHAAQNMMLQAAALDLGSVAVGAFYDDQVATILELTKGTIPLYLVPIGYPA